MFKKKRILVAPLNWGLGHATRCIPIINTLLKANYEVILGSDGPALHLLKKEFPYLEAVELPSYQIKYHIKGKNFKRKIIFSLPEIYKAVRAEKALVKDLIEEKAIDGIISDSRFGVYSKKIPSVYITHQLNVLTGNTTWLSTKLHRQVIRNFDECWVPDSKDRVFNYSGFLGHAKNLKLVVKYFGIISRMTKIDLPLSVDFLILLSGPEPQRSVLEDKLKTVFSTSDKKVVMVRGIVEEEQKWTNHGKINVVNFVQFEELQTLINESKVVISRSGYTTIMDLSMLEKKAFFIPTPGQYEQEYLAKRLSDQGIVPYSEQEKFKVEFLAHAGNYEGLKPCGYTKEALVDLFRIF